MLAWVAKGKTNAEVGVILEMSDRTVQKHLEHIYQKLGVETRTTAAVRALKMLGIGVSSGVRRNPTSAMSVPGLRRRQPSSFRVTSSNRSSTVQRCGMSRCR